MGLIVKSTVDKKILIKGTDIELPEVYVRIEFGCRPNGKTMDIGFYVYANKTNYNSDNQLPTNLLIKSISIDIDLLTQTQNVSVAHQLAKEHFESLGYECLIDLII
jgi:hypothetical protein